MCKKFIFLSAILLLLAVSVQANLVAYYPFEGNANDMSGFGNIANGTLVGAPTYDVGPGNFGQALKVSSTSNYVNCGNDAKINITGPMTVSVWIKVTAWTTAWNAVVTKGDTSWRLHRDNATNNLNWTCSGTSAGGVSGITAVNDDKWHHVAGVYDGANLILYLDGKVDAQVASTGSITTNTNNMFICENATYTGRTYTGWIDEVRIYDNALSAGEVLAVMAGKRGLPSNPKPSGSEVSIDVGGISWKPGEFANTHDVFFGTDFNDVNEATLTNPLGTTVYEGLALEVNSISLDRLPYGTTYYWRVDEVNAPSKPATISGGIWNFTTEPQAYTIAKTSIIDVTTAGTPAYDDQEPNSTCNGKGLDANDMHSIDYPGMWLGMVDEDAPVPVWIQYEFDKAYMFHDMLVWNYNEESPSEGFGVKDADISYSLDGVVWTTLPTVTFNIATGDNTCIGNTTVELNGAVAKFVRITFLTSFEGSNIYGISEVRFSAEPTFARNPSPATAATGQAINAALKWKAGRYSVEHYVYISTDANDVNNVPGHSVAPIVVTDANLIPGLDLNKKYYWRVDEVNMANAYTTWTGPTWNLSTVQSLLLDGFEKGYGTDDTNAVWATWIDGYNTTNNGAQISVNINAPGLSTTIYHGTTGKSVPVTYNNTGTAADSSVTAQSVKLQRGTNDWSIGSPTTLTIWFRGETTNVLGDEELYCTIGGKTAVYGGNLAAYLKLTEWKQWDIDLATLGVTLTNIPQITIGIRKTGATGSTGIIYLDDIQLTALKALYVGPSLYVEAETMTLTGRWRPAQTSQTGFSGTGYIDTLNSEPSGTEPNLASLATYAFTSTGGKYMVNIRYRPSYSGTWRNSFFVRIINGSGTPAATDVTLQTANGWVNCDELTYINPWGWDIIYNRNASNVNADVTWTLPAGNYTIQFSQKETGPKLDVVEIMKTGN